jgi:prepilin-type N-terminal cleavage/methylation domain-containing protein
MKQFYRYLLSNTRGKKGQSGFTLIELLVVVTILGILAGIVTLSLVGLTTNAQAKSCQQEYKTVQAALDAYMATNNIDIVLNSAGTTTATTTVATNNMGTPVKLYDGAPTQDNPTYLRNSPTQWAYVWNNTGRITSIAKAGTGPDVPTGCSAVPTI